MATKNSAGNVKAFDRHLKVESFVESISMTLRAMPMIVRKHEIIVM